MSLKLYEIKAEYDLLLASANEVAEANGGEVPGWLFDKLNAIEEAMETKVANCGGMYKNLSGEAEAIAAEIKRLTARKKAAENQADWLKGYIASCVPSGSKISTPQCAISWRKSEVVVIDSEILVPDEYCKIKREVSKTMVKDAIKANQVVLGAHIEEKQNIQIK
jgi:hypothetical protein